MSTQRFGANPGYSLEQVVQAVGAATAANNVELTVDMATTIVNDNGSTRQITRLEVLIVLRLMEEYIGRMNWPPVAS